MFGGPSLKDSLNSGPGFRPGVGLQGLMANGVIGAAAGGFGGGIGGGLGGGIGGFRGLGGGPANNLGFGGQGANLGGWGMNPRERNQLYEEAQQHAY